MGIDVEDCCRFAMTVSNANQLFVCSFKYYFTDSTAKVGLRCKLSPKAVVDLASVMMVTSRLLRDRHQFQLSGWLVLKSSPSEGAN